MLSVFDRRGWLKRGIRSRFAAWHQIKVRTAKRRDLDPRWQPPTASQRLVAQLACARGRGT